jgi:hypothetical protein
MVLQETEAGIAMGGVQHYYCTAQRPHSQKHNLALERRDPLRAGTDAAANCGWISVQRNGGCAGVSKDAIPASCSSDQSRSCRLTSLRLRLLAVEVTRLLLDWTAKGGHDSSHTVHHRSLHGTVVGSRW